MSQFAFYSLAGLCLFFAMGVVLIRGLLMAAVALMGLLATTAAIYAYFGFSFLAGMQILVYVAGTVVLIVFAILLSPESELKDPRPQRVPYLWGLLISLSFFGFAAYALQSGQLHSEASGGEFIGGNVQALGLKLMSSEMDGYVLPLELVSLVLLAVLIGGIVLGRSHSAEKSKLASSSSSPNKEVLS